MPAPAGPMADLSARSVPMSAGDSIYQQLTNGSPDEWPEVLREATSLVGAGEGAMRAVALLEERLAHVLKPESPAGVASPPHPYDVQTPVGSQLRNAYYTASALEHRVHDLIARLAI